jgi:hypothetical protein
VSAAGAAVDAVAADFLPKAMVGFSSLGQSSEPFQETKYSTFVLARQMFFWAVRASQK